MKLKELNITSYKGIENLEINFDHSEVNYFKNLMITILVGENGSGKTTLLKLISKAFCPNATREREEEEAVFTLKYEINNNPYIIPTEKKEIDIDIIFPKKIIVSSFSVFDPYSSNQISSNKVTFPQDPTEYVYCGPNSIANVSSVSSIIPSIMRILYAPELDTKKLSIFKRLLNNINYGPVQYFEISLNKKHYGIEERYSQNSQSDESMRIRATAFLEELKRKRDRSKGKPKSKNNSFVIRASDFSSGFFETYLQLIEKGYGSCIRDIWFAKEGQDISLSSMSSGEITMLFRFVPLILKMEHNSVLLIDEPETHMHPRWIQQYIGNLIDLLGEYQSHVIIATHSPTIASEAPAECIIGLEKKKEQYIKVYHVKNRTLGGDPSKILKDVFHLETYRGNLANELMNQVVELLKKGDENSKQKAMQIYHDLSTTMDKFKFFIEHEELLEE